MCFTNNKCSNNVATATKPIDIHVHTAEISFLVCEQMENADIG